TYCKNWKKEYKNEVRTLKASIKSMPDGQDKTLAKKQLKEYKKTRQPCWADYNKHLYQKLKSKSHNYQP
ncbi:MAG: hypothetical protein K2F58_01615, partial [Muribaculaceae bacterium]|nr:hypothetical protein [Muribaculaceae bacterium]